MKLLAGRLQRVNRRSAADRRCLEKGAREEESGGWGLDIPVINGFTRLRVRAADNDQLVTDCVIKLSSNSFKGDEDIRAEGSVYLI